MSNLKDGGQAFPHDPAAVFNERAGMTLRDYFAAKAMQGWLSSYGPDDKHPATVSGDASLLAKRSYAMADAMLSARGE